MINYNAPNPYAHQAASESPVSPLNQLISLNILPAQTNAREDVDWKTLEWQLAIAHIDLDYGNVYTHDGAVINTIQLTPKTQYQLATIDKSFVIKFIGNHAQYAGLLPTFINDAERLAVTIIGFNYRGVGYSQKAPTSFQALVTDGIAQVQRLLDQGANPENITLDGHSLGGAIAIMVASHFHRLGKKVYLFNDRSLGDIAMIAHERLNVGSVVNGIPASLNMKDLSTVKALLTMEGWETELAKTYLSIPVKYRRHVYVGRSKENPSGDGVIPHAASLHRCVKEQERGMAAFTGYKVYAKAKFFGSAHTLEREKLICKRDETQTAYDVYREFVKRR